MTEQETPINAATKRRRRLRAALDGAAIGFEERLLWPAGDALRSLNAAARAAFESIAWVLRRGLIWPLQDRAGALGAPGRAIAAIAAVLVVGIGVFAVLSATSGDSSKPAVAKAPAPASAPLEVAATTKQAAAEPTLQGATPVFEPVEAKDSSRVEAAKPIESSPAPPADPATATIGSKGGASTSSTSPSSTAQAASVDGPPAGPEAIAVARDFAGAFVLYETGGEDAEVRKAFAATATQELAKSLLRRPPRLPADVEVPKAKVVNVVAGPSHGPIYSVSVSLLRVGLTSELRLDMERLKNDRWLVTNVLG